ncbi:MAG TPA: mevalonate kinase [Saprospiraceae bacterium]|nr:mevalonate kinase [Saprospiraceae bacterium]HMP23463.1 mevalonate kinase [Saprospiraceae bacterium]
MRHYASKILLFGEHTINRGSQALAIPYPVFGGVWQCEHQPSAAQDLRPLLAHLEDLQAQNALLCPLQLAAFRADLEAGWHFAANIPVGYGLGSSGALCAAIYERFCAHPIRPEETSRLGELRQALAQIESFFHGSSSGVDPLICYLNQPLLIQPGGHIQIVKIPEGGPLVFFLLDTGMARSTGPLVQYFLQKCADPPFGNRVTRELAAYNDLAIAAFLQAEWEHLFADVSDISRFQLEELPGMIPDHFQTVWQQGLQGNLYRLKLCGAGGGGFMLGCTMDWAQTQSVLSDFVLQKAYPLG